jgi:hypothetical protein
VYPPLRKRKITPKICSLCCFFFLVVVLCVCMFFWLKYLKRTVIRILMCCLYSIFVCFARTSCPFLKTNSTIQHITRSFCCFFFSVLFHCSHRSFLSLSHFTREKLCISVYSFSYLLLLLFWFDDDDDDYVYGMHSLICFSLICDR